ncbi:hypothetical protein BRADO3610 [Bradyrhizobium sp. ORS 278]|uniref:hypothetical protein n=1 Tax=Bradyrhizobium sp. (strain ORS 278) TaxID=114615 RepID=UPI0001508E47|nr:hypothetical protein [Bradyrhizobium sp. ORS 278]CAL77388.1 hypothetical protein BRADO3610 [Bradyrhizobium sp. ORS 278]
MSALKSMSFKANCSKLDAVLSELRNLLPGLPPEFADRVPPVDQLYRIETVVARKGGVIEVWILPSSSLYRVLADAIDAAAEPRR